MLPIMTEDLSAVVAIDQVLGSTAFSEIGQAYFAVQDPRSKLLAIGGMPGHPNWIGNAIHWQSPPAPGWYRVGIYEPETLRCVHTFALTFPVNTFAFHPELPILAIGLGSYDGGFAYEGELIMLDLTTGHTVSVLDETRDIGQLRWLDSQRLHTTLAVRTEWEEEQLGGQGQQTELVVADWSSVTDRTLHIDDADCLVIDDYVSDMTTIAAAEQILADWASHAGRRRDERNRVWAVEALTDGRILAGSSRMTAECWGRTGELFWSVPTRGIGCQFVVHPSQQTVITSTWAGFMDESHVWQKNTKIERLSLAGGAASLICDLEDESVMTNDVEGRIAIRQQSRGGRVATMLTPNGDPAGDVELSGRTAPGLFFNIRRSPDLLILSYYKTRPRATAPLMDESWVVRLDVERCRDERLFPFGWEPEHISKIFGGPGVFLDGDEPAIVHGCHLWNQAGMIPGNSLIARRSYPDGRVRWVHADDNQVTAIDRIKDTIYATLNSGELLALDARTGHVLGRQLLRVDGHRVVPISLSTEPRGTIVVGTMDGRILRGSALIRAI